MLHVIIVGGGLSGLTTAYQLKKQSISFKVLEAQNRPGGRILTIRGERNTPMEMGATWFGEVHENLIQLLNELNIIFFPQHSEGIAMFQTRSFEPPQQFFIPSGEGVSYRIKDGTDTLIQSLYNVAGKEHIFLNTRINKIIDRGDFLTLIDDSGAEHQSKIVISAIPPQLFFNTVETEPSFPQQLQEVLGNVQTWMNGSIKFSVEYAIPFWRQRGFSGTVFSQAGIAVEIYDHTNFESSRFSLVGFLNDTAVNYSFDQREIMVIDQLVNLFGSQAKEYTAYYDKVWSDKYITSHNTPVLLPHQNNGHPLFHQSYLGNKLYFTGTETAVSHPGYMEGAIVAANTTVDRVIKGYGKKRV